MSGARMAALEAAARVWRDQYRHPAPGHYDNSTEASSARHMLVAAIDALDAIPSPPPGETERVRVAVYRNRRTGDLDFCAPHQITPDRVLAIVTADIPTDPPPAPPEVAGSVEAPT